MTEINIRSTIGNILKQGFAAASSYEHKVHLSTTLTYMEWLLNHSYIAQLDASTFTPVQEWTCMKNCIIQGLHIIFTYTYERL